MNAAFKDCFRIAAKTLRKRLEFLIKSDSRYPLNKKVDALVRAGYSYSEAIDIVLDETQNQELTRDSLMIEYEKPKTWRMNDLIAEYKKLLTALQRIANWPPLASYPGLYDELDIARLNLKHIQRYAKDALEPPALDSAERKAGWDEARLQIKTRLLKEALESDPQDAALICRLATICCGYPDTE